MPLDAPAVPRPVPAPSQVPSRLAPARQDRRDGHELLLRGQPRPPEINLKILSNQVTALIGPSGCGKSTFLRSLNRMNDIIPGARVEGEVQIDGQDIYAPSWTSWTCGGGSAWCSRSRIPSRSRSSTTWPTAADQPDGGVARRPARPGRDEPEVGGALGRSEGSPALPRRWRSRAASSSGCASPARSRSSRKSC